MTSLEIIYESFLFKVKEDEWDDITELNDYEKCWKSYLLSAIGYFKFPRKSLKFNEDKTAFAADLDDEEIQILSDYMKVEWLQGSILTWEQIKGEYPEAEFSHANLLDKLDKTLKTTISRAERKEKNYYRSINGEPFDYSQLAGKGKD